MEFKCRFINDDDDEGISFFAKVASNSQSQSCVSAVETRLCMME